MKINVVPCFRVAIQSPGFDARFWQAVPAKNVHLRQSYTVKRENASSLSGLVHTAGQA